METPFSRQHYHVNVAKNITIVLVYGNISKSVILYSQIHQL